MTYLFDIGNVLLAFDFLPALNSLKGKNASATAVEELLHKKDALESGLITVDEYLLLVRSILDYQGSDAHFFETWNSIFTKIPATFELAKSLKKQGHRLILFSNISPIHSRHCLDTYNLSSIFDHAVFSHEIKAIKPDDPFFTRAFQQFKIVPEETIYIDDLVENIAAGERHGLKSFCYDYKKHHDLITWLEKIHENK